MPSSSGKLPVVGISSVTVGGIKSLMEEQTVNIRPLTIFAGPNSSGKSSIMQGLLLLKQTLESPFDPGTLLLSGQNVKFTSSDQLLSRRGTKRITNSFVVGLTLSGKFGAKTWFSRKPSNQGFGIKQASYHLEGQDILLRPGMKTDDLLPVKHTPAYRIFETIADNTSNKKPNGSSRDPKLEMSVYRDRCFLDVEVFLRFGDNSRIPMSPSTLGAPDLRTQVQNIIHLPGLRGNPERLYPMTAVGETFPGTFDQYVASIIAHWQLDNKSDSLLQIGSDLEALGLTWKVEARAINDTQVELLVGRMPKSKNGGDRDTVGIPDVGFGVSQTLPVVVALEVARPGQLVYLEQPEIHLHPKAQAALAQILLRAAKRGVKVVAETHSSLLLRGLQTAVASGEISPDQVGLHWFSRRPEDGCTIVRTAEVDSAGGFGDWPVDFDDIYLAVDTEYLNAAERRVLDRND